MLFNKIPQNNLEFHVNEKRKTEKHELMTKTARNKIYWISQLSGWMLFALVNIIIVISFDKFAWGRILLSGYLSLLGILFTHILRKLIKKWNWDILPLKKITPRVLLSSVIIGITMFFLFWGTGVLTGVFQPEKFKIVNVLLGSFNISSVILLWSLIYFSVHYFENYKRVEIESYIWEAAVKDFELKTLKSQLNPHFMFNALNSIRALIEEDPEKAKEAVTRLSNILRYSLKIERTEMVSLEDEMRTVADYLSLESIRFEERLKYHFEIEPKSERIEIPPMMIQTLVENGIKHGISKRTEGGFINISSRIEDSKLKIEIKNSGQVSPEDLKNSKGFGISNTKHRLSLLYGEKAFFLIKNFSENEVITEVVIPTGGIKNESFNY